MIKLMFKIKLSEIKLLDTSEFCFRLDDKAFLRKKKPKHFKYRRLLKNMSRILRGCCSCSKVRGKLQEH